jgi:hypothetical protein
LPPDPNQMAQSNLGGTGQLGQPGQQPGQAQAGQAQPGQLQNTQNSPLSNDQAAPDQMSPATGVQGANSMNAIRRMLTNPNSQTQAGGLGRSGIMSGGLAGVASKAKGQSIKLVNDQDDYSLWEFYYDPMKDIKQGLPAGAGFGNAQGAGRNALSTGFNSVNALPPSRPPGMAGTNPAGQANLPAPVMPPVPGNQNAPASGAGASSGNPAPNDIPTTTDNPPDNSQAPNDNPPPEDTPPQ